MKKRLKSALLIPMLLIITASISYAYWTDQITIKHEFTTGTIETEIGSHKTITNYNDDHITVIQPNKETLQIICQVSPSWYLWIGLLIHNEGTLPVRVVYFTISTNNTAIWNQYFTREEYFYGPCSDGDFTNVWAPYPPNTPPPPGNVPLSTISLDHCQKMVVWQHLYISDAYSDSVFGLEITITYTVELAIP